jgi:hypothetical protein
MKKNIVSREINNYGELLEFATGKKCLCYKEFGSYQGDYIAILKRPNGIEIWKGSYGSCSGCDWIEAEVGPGGTITKEKALSYLKDEKPFLTILKGRIKVLLKSENIESFFPRNTRNDYDDWNWEDIKKMLSKII